ncbi:MAG: translation initiation factor [Thermovirgaceae bacterium]|nr:translation initiation factor [Thermovirgaceae bacterium]
MAKRNKIPVDGTAEKAVNTVLGDLLRESGLAGDAEPRRDVPAVNPVKPTAAVSLPDFARAGKIVLRVQRKGRGGKTVTILSGSGLAANQMEPLVKALRKGLGCGARVEEGVIVLQGDVSERAERWLRDRGSKQIVGGS